MMETFEQILTKYNCPQRTDKQIIAFGEIENVISFKLPNDYKSFLQCYLSLEEFIGEEFVRLWGFEELMEHNTGYLIFENLPFTLGIGTNGGGELIAIEQLIDGNCRVVITPFIDLDEEYHIEIGTSFTDFLERLDNGQEWFNTKPD